MIFFADYVRLNVPSLLPKFLLTGNFAEAINYSGTVVLFIGYDQDRTIRMEILNERNRRNLKTKVIFDCSWETGCPVLHNIEMIPTKDLLYIVNRVCEREKTSYPDYCNYLAIDFHGLDAYNRITNDHHPVDSTSVEHRRNGINLLVGKIKTRFSRFLTTYYFYKHNLLDTSILGIHGKPEDFKNMMSTYPEYNDQQFYDKIINHLGPADNADRLVTSEGMTATDGWPFDPKIFANSSVTYTCETFDYDKGINPYMLTEKFYRPIINRHPFIVQGSPGQLETYKKLGYRTFSDIIDESYNNVYTPDRSHVELAVKAAARLVEKIPFHQIEIKEIVDHNYSYFVRTMEKHYKDVLRTLLDFGYSLD